MQDFSPVEIITYTLAAVVIGVVFVRSYFDRRRRPIIALASREFDFQNAAPFDLAYSVGTEIEAKPNTEIVPSLFLYFNASEKPRISYHQQENAAPYHDKSHRYFLRISQHDVIDLEWLAIERRIELPMQPAGSRVECKVQARASEASIVKLLLIYQAENGEEKRIDLGTRQLSAEFSEFELDVNLDDHRFQISDGQVLLRYVVLAEIKERLKLDIQSWDFDVVATGLNAA